MAQAGAYLIYDLSQPTPRPFLSVRMEGEGKGQVLITRATDGMTLARCVPEVDELGDIRSMALIPGIVATTQRLSDLIARRNDPPVMHAMREIEGPRCRIEVDPGTQVRLSAVVGERMTFGGYQQLPMRTPAELVPLLGDPMASCLGSGDVMAQAAAGDVLDCPLTVRADTSIAVEFGKQPEEIDVAFADDKAIADLVKPLTPVVPPAPIDAEKLDEKALEVAI
nr:hypothetical protein [Deltaproteobacteria bacterium]